jgi:hypothetical protein
MRISASFHHASRCDKRSSGTARETIRKISFKPASRRSSHLRSGHDRPAHTERSTALCRAYAQVHKFPALSVAVRTSNRMWWLNVESCWFLRVGRTIARLFLSQTWRILENRFRAALLGSPGLSWTMACPWLGVPPAVIDGCANDRQTSEGGMMGRRKGSLPMAHLKDRILYNNFLGRYVYAIAT